jgi:hypothetical protein
MRPGVLTYALSDLAYRVGVVRSLAADEEGAAAAAAGGNCVAATAVASAAKVGPPAGVVVAPHTRVNNDLASTVLSRFAELERHTVSKVEEVFHSLSLELERAKGTSAMVVRV